MSVLTAGAIPTVWDGEPVLPGSPTHTSLAAMVAFAVALETLILAVFRLGALTRVISPPVLTGFCSASAFLIASTQFSNVVGLPKCVGTGGGSCNFNQAIANVINNKNAIPHFVPLASFVCLCTLFFLKLVLPKLLPKRLRAVGRLAPLLLVIITVPIMYKFNKELSTNGIKPGSSIPAGLPSPVLPFISGSASDYTGLLVAAIPLTLIGYMESITITAASSRQFGPYDFEPSQELWALAAANAAGACRYLPTECNINCHHVL